MEEIQKKGKASSETRLPYSTRIGKAKSIGVSNFSEAKLAEILPTAKVIPAVNQVSRGSISSQTAQSELTLF